MTVLIIGSAAISNYRDSNDLDIVCTYDDFKKIIDSIRKHLKVKSIYPINDGKKMIAKFFDENDKLQIIEADIAWPESLAEDLLNVTKHSFSFYPNMLNQNWDKDNSSFVDNVVFSYSSNDIKWSYAPKEVLYMLKMSHRYLRNSPHFKKTMDDIIWMRKEFFSPEWLEHHKNTHVQDYLQEHYIRRMREQYSYSHPKLNVTKNEFFTGDGVKYTYDHDSIHENILSVGIPMYKYFSVGEVQSSKELFYARLTHRGRLEAVLEESCVLALERSLIPFEGQLTYKEAFVMALNKVCTSITSGWFREFAWENYYEVLDMFDEKYFYNFFNNVLEGKVKLYE